MEIDENSIEANGVYDDFIRIGNNIYSKVSEGTNGSVYQNIHIFYQYIEILVFYNVRFSL